MDKPEHLGKVMEHVESASIVALDTEFISFPWFRPKLEVVQLATDECLAAVDIQLLKDSATPLLDLLLKKKLVVHACKYDLMLLLLANKLSAQNPPKMQVFDTQVAAAFSSTHAHSYPISCPDMSWSCE